MRGLGISRSSGIMAAIFVLLLDRKKRSVRRAST
jgi:hypothetical protein